MTDFAWVIEHRLSPTRGLGRVAVDEQAGDKAMKWILILLVSTYGPTTAGTSMFYVCAPSR